MIQLTVSLFLLWSGGADTTFHINRLFAPGQQPARCSIYTAIVFCEMSEPWPDVMTKFIISPVKSSTDNRLLRGVIREGCLAVAWDTVITVISQRPLTGLRILCNQIYLRQLCPIPGLHTRYFTVTSNSL